MKTGSVPISLDGFGLDGDLGTEFFGDAIEEVASHPEMISHCSNPSVSWIPWCTAALLTCNALARTNLEFPLRWHHFGVDARDLQASVEACLVMGLDNVSTEDLAGADTAVIWSLRGWEATLGPAVWPSICVEDGVFLFQAKPRHMLGIGFHQPLTFMTIVVFVGGSIGIPGLGHHQDIVATTERIGEDGAGANADIGVLAGGLAGGRTIEIPFR